MSLDKNDVATIREIVVDAIDKVIIPRFDGLEGRMDGLEGKMDGLEGRMDGLEGKMDKLEHQTRQLTEAQRETTKILTSLENKVDGVDGRLKAIENDVKELYMMISKTPQIKFNGKAYNKLTDKDKLLALNTAVLDLAKNIGVSLPR